MAPYQWRDSRDARLRMTDTPPVLSVRSYNIVCDNRELHGVCDGEATDAEQKYETVCFVPVTLPASPHVM